MWNRLIILKTAATYLAWSISVLASAAKPVTAQQTWLSISWSLSILFGTNNLDDIFFSDASTIPSEKTIPKADQPN